MTSKPTREAIAAVLDGASFKGATNDDPGYRIQTADTGVRVWHESDASMWADMDEAEVHPKYAAVLETAGYTVEREAHALTITAGSEGK